MECTPPPNDLPAYRHNQDQGIPSASQFLHSVGWVHRGISTGNVLRATQIGELADLEYANRKDSNNTHEAICEPFSAVDS
ncbi:hypothetical protein BKA83DRAFT_4321108 [Pisolithus microcarpus]|nr:hypothetical protein BKA83DRAFT_4321108 [Pisolithus microcarpus]